MSKVEYANSIRSELYYTPQLDSVARALTLRGRVKLTNALGVEVEELGRRWAAAW